MKPNRNCLRVEFERLESRVMFAVIEGQIFRDENANGIHDEGEVGLDGWSVDALEQPTHMFSRPESAISRSIDKNGEGIIDPVSESGWYSIRTQAGKYQVSSRPRPNWHVVSPVGGTIQIDLDDDSSTVTQDFAIARQQAGDFNGDAVINSIDIQLMCEAFQEHRYEAKFDLDGDHHLDTNDFDELIEGTLASTIGDANLDRRFDSLDLIMVLQRGQYNDNIVGNSTWEDGDWNCDGEFDPFDLISAFMASDYISASEGDFASPYRDKHFFDLDPDRFEDTGKVDVVIEKTRDSNSNNKRPRRVDLRLLAIESVFNEGDSLKNPIETASHESTLPFHFPDETAVLLAAETTPQLLRAK